MIRRPPSWCALKSLQVGMETKLKYVEDDILKLKNEYGLDCSKSADIHSAAIKKWSGRFQRPGLKDLAMDVLGIHMKNPIKACMSNKSATLHSSTMHWHQVSNPSTFLHEYGLDCARSADIRSATIKRWPNMYYRKPVLKHLARDVASHHMEYRFHVSGQLVMLMLS
ncbi:Werner syndrome-like exonuclease [Tanacetum coccineum]